MSQENQRWEDLPRVHRERLEAELRARGIDPSTVKSVRIEKAEAPRPPTASGPDGDDGLIDLAAGPAGGDASGAGGRTIRTERIEININGEKKVYGSMDEVPMELRGVIDALKAQAEGDGNEKRSGVTVTHTVSHFSSQPIGGKDFPTDEIMVLLRQGKKIEAIKVLRERTGMGLAEAKQAVDAIDATIEGGKRRSGCAGMIVLAAGVGIALGVAARAGFGMIA
jgi:ribosomal protein L7/L12